jgi:hypothetical protein
MSTGSALRWDQHTCEEEGRWGGFGCGGDWPRWCSFYRVNGARGGGSTQVVVGCFKSFDYRMGRMKWMHVLVLIVTYDF